MPCPAVGTSMGIIHHLVPRFFIRYENHIMPAFTGSITAYIVARLGLSPKMGLPSLQLPKLSRGATWCSPRPARWLPTGLPCMP